MKDGKATGEFEDFLVGFVTKDGNVWGRPVGVTVEGRLADGDGRRRERIWRISAGNK